MSNSEHVTPYQSKKGKKQQVTDMFDNIAPKYDLLNRVLSLGIDVSWRKKLVAAVISERNNHVLDIATGTGDVAIMLARQSTIEHITGLDISEKMLKYAKAKTEKKQLQKRISYVIGDSENLPFEDNTYDAVTVAFGVRNFEDTQEGLRECYRVLKEGGKFGVLEFSQPLITPFKQFYNVYFKYLLPLIGKMTSKDPKAYTYLFESVQSFPSGEVFAGLLKKVGFKTIHFRRLTFGICTLYVAVK